MPDQHTPPPQTAGAPRWLRWGFVLSLCLNLLVLGMVGGWMLKGAKHHGPPHGRMQDIGGPLTRALSKDDRREIGRAMMLAIREDGGGRAVQHAMVTDLIAAVRSDPFDRAALAEVMMRQRDMLGGRLELGQSLLLDHLAQMSPAERAEYAERLEQGAKRKWRKKE